MSKASRKALSNKISNKAKSVEHQATHPLETVKNVVKNAGQAAKVLEQDAKSIKEGVGKVAHEAAIVATFAPLAIMSPLMKASLKKKGVNLTGEKIPQVAGLFLKHVIAGAPVVGGHLEHEEADNSDAASQIADAVADAIANNTNYDNGSGGGGGGGGDSYSPYANPYVTPAVVAAATNPSVLATANTMVGPKLNPVIHVTPAVRPVVQSARRANTSRTAYRKHLENFQLWDIFHNLKKRGHKIEKIKTAGELNEAVAQAGVIHSLEHVDVTQLSKVATEVQTGVAAIKSGNSQVEDAAFKAADMLAQNSGVPGADMVVTIIHKILDFVKGQQAKSKGQPLTADEAKVLGQTPVDTELVATADEVQDQLAKVGEPGVFLKSTDTPPPHHLTFVERVFPKIFIKKHPDWYKK